MKHFSPNNWQDFITQKYVKKIYEQITKKKYAQTLILFDLLLLVFGVILDRFFEIDDKSFMLWYFIALLCITLFCVFIVIIIFVTKKIISWKNITLTEAKVEDMIYSFNNMVCYDVITSKSYLKLYLSNNIITKSERTFYFLESSYYRNKSIKQLFSMIHRVADVFSKESTTVISSDKISIDRLKNILNLIDEITLILEKEIIEDKTMDNVELIQQENKYYTDMINRLKRKINEKFC